MPCYALGVNGECLSGHVLVWVRDTKGWHAVLHYSRRMDGGWIAQYGHAVPASGLEPRN